MQIAQSFQLVFLLYPLLIPLVKVRYPFGVVSEWYRGGNGGYRVGGKQKRLPWRAVSDV
jgi:hypothetical protein